jgi:hypothetical protein
MQLQIDAVLSSWIPQTTEEEEREVNTEAIDNLYCLVSWGTEPDPNNRKEAQASKFWPKWAQGETSEYKGLLENCTWELVKLPPGRKPIGCRWTYKTKIKKEGTQYKCRLVAQGFSQKFGVDFRETYAPVARMASIRTLIALATKFDMELKGADISQAFLHGKLDETIYMNQPPGFEDGTDRVCLLRRSIYGLRQASRVFNETLHKALIDLGFKRSKVDHGLYMMHDEHKRIKMLITTWVDDLAIAYRNQDDHDELMKGLRSVYKLTDLGELDKLIGMEITRDRANKTTKITQSAYTKKILENFLPREGSKWSARGTPSAPGVQLSKDMEALTPEEKTFMADKPFRSAIGALMYLMIGTRPDIAFAVCACARYMHNPGEKHWEAVKHIFRYLSGTSDLGLEYNCNSNAPERSTALLGYSDSDWGGNQDTRRSTTGYIFFVYGCPVSWKSKLQVTVSKSSTEAEYQAVSDAASECVYLRNLLQDITTVSVTKMKPVMISVNKFIDDNQDLTKDIIAQLKVDNQGAIKLAENPVQHQRTKHIDISHHYIRELLQESKTIQLEYVQSKLNASDILTKGSHSVHEFVRLRNQICVK